MAMWSHNRLTFIKLCSLASLVLPGAALPYSHGHGYVRISRDASRSASIVQEASPPTSLVGTARVSTTPLSSTISSSSTTPLSSTISSSSTQGSVYTPLTPYRIVDTRSNATDPSTYAGKTLGANSTLNVQVNGVSGPQGQSVPSGATAVVLTVTALSTSSTVAGGYLSIYPEGGSQPVVSNLNFGPGQIVNNTVTVPLSSSGGISIYNYNGSTNVLVDVDGYYAAPQAGSTAGLYNAITPTRVLDTRTGSPFGALSANTTESLSVVGSSTGIPSTASAVVANITAIGTSSTVPGGYLTAWPTGTTMPNTSILNISEPGQVVATNVILPVGSNGDINLYNYNGSTNVLVDLYGYYTGNVSGATGSQFYPVTPTRVVGTSTSGEAIAGGSSSSFTLANGTPVPATASAVAANLTVSQTTAWGYLSVNATSTPPATSNLNWTGPSQVVANADEISLSSGAASFYNGSSGSADLMVDVFGYFEPPVSTAVTVTATPASIAANGTSTSTITATVIQNGSPLSGDQVMLAFTPTTGAGTLSCTTAVTNSSGEATVTYTASTTTGSFTITATEAADGMSGSTTVTQTTPSNTVSVSASPASLSANGSTSSAITAVVTSPSGLAVSGDTVSFTESPSPAGACGTLSPTSATTNSSGDAVVTYLSSTTSGFCTITATESATGGSGTAVVTQTSPTATNTPYTVTVTATPASIAANGTSTSTITATVKNSAITPVANDPVMFTVTTSGGGTLSSATALTNSSGVATVTYTSSTYVGSVTISATEANNDQSGTGTVTQTVTSTVNVTASPSSIPANGTSTSTITATVTTTSGAPVSGATVDFSVSSGGGTFSTSSGSTNSSGQVSVVYISSTTSGFYTITANDTTSPTGSGTVTIDQTAVS